MSEEKTSGASKLAALRSKGTADFIERKMIGQSRVDKTGHGERLALVVSSAMSSDWEVECGGHRVFVWFMPSWTEITESRLEILLTIEDVKNEVPCVRVEVFTPQSRTGIKTEAHVVIQRCHELSAAYNSICDLMGHLKSSGFTLI